MDSRRALPSVTKVLAELSSLPHGLAVEVARSVIDDARARLEGGEPVTEEAVLGDARRRSAEIGRSLLQPVINATGVIVHTNLGRAPLGPAALAAVADVASGYSNLEFRLDRGTRGSRQEHAGTLLARACGAEAAVVVNNNAAAVMLVLAALARGREVIVSRGELVEIGGGFRVPDVMAESGARLVEVGTTNRTRRADYERAMSAETAMILRVHASNYRMVGFVESTPVDSLAGLGPPVVVDIGSGLLDESTPWLAEHPAWLRDEPGARQCLEAGAALVTFSGDKLLGGPQAGVIAGRADLVGLVARHPLARAVRADKMALAALQSVALAYLADDGDAIPLWRMAATPVGVLRERAEGVAGSVSGAKVVDTEAVAGGGSLPGLTIPSCGVSVEVSDADAALAALRSAGIVARVDAGAVVCDLRTVDPSDDARLAAALATITR
ncbi:MAG TPA: L-seryl-tRNA(Sec) selenium transferase [Acidimicrobiia bacterium]|nr:L-seryl-tRNA(Sec) selenium transferase [Acidimicrobiia bacterium]